MSYRRVIEVDPSLTFSVSTRYVPVGNVVSREQENKSGNATHITPIPYRLFVIHLLQGYVSSHPATIERRRAMKHVINAVVIEFAILHSFLDFILM